MSRPPLEWYEDHWRVREPDGRWDWLGRLLGYVVIGLSLVGFQVLFNILID